MVRIEQRLADMEAKLDMILAAIAELQIAALVERPAAPADDRPAEPKPAKRGK